MPIIQTLEGDLLNLFESQNFDGIAHGCNCHTAMASGIAAQIAKRFPQAVDADNEYFDWMKGDEMEGKYSTAISIYGTIFNMYTQLYPGRESPVYLYRNIRESFTLLNDNIKIVQLLVRQGQRFHLGIPLIGAGIAGGCWDIIKAIIDEATPDIDITVVKWHLESTGLVPKQ